MHHISLRHGLRFFFSMRRTVSRLTLPKPGSRRAARSSSIIVQRWRPVGGTEHASAVTRASASVSYCRGRLHDQAILVGQIQFRLTHDNPLYIERRC